MILVVLMLIAGAYILFGGSNKESDKAALDSRQEDQSGGDQSGEEGALPESKVTASVSDAEIAAPITYTDDPAIFSVQKTEFDVSDRFTAKQLSDNSAGCGTGKSEDYFDNLLSYYPNGAKGVEYSFVYSGKSQQPEAWKVTVLPNIGYDDAGEFMEDFDVCSAGGEMYPTQLSSRFLLFESSCGTGFDDGSGLVHGCDAVQKAVLPTLKLK